MDDSEPDLAKAGSPNEPGLELEGEGTDESGNAYVRVVVTFAEERRALVWRLDDMRHAIPPLINLGARLHTPASERELLDRVQTRPARKPSFSVATKLGWHENAFVLPDVVIGLPSRPVELFLQDMDTDSKSKYRQQGTLKEWQENIGSHCDRNSRLMFAIALAFAGPVLRFSNAEDGGFQIFGAPGKGKTTAAVAAGSVWGFHSNSAKADRGFAETWAQTVNNLERVAGAHNNGLLILDETKQAGEDDAKRWKVISAAIIRLAENTGKGRLTGC